MICICLRQLSEKSHLWKIVIASPEWGKPAMAVTLCPARLILYGTEFLNWAVFHPPPSLSLFSLPFSWLSVGLCCCSPQDLDFSFNPKIINTDPNTLRHWPQHLRHSPPPTDTGPNTLSHWAHHPETQSPPPWDESEREESYCPKWNWTDNLFILCPIP